MSAVDVPLVEGHCIPQTPDIIDVDAFEADDVVYVGSARPSQRRRVAEDGRAVPVDREVIHVTDNEDDNEIQFIGHNPARPPPPSVRRERLFSPPPPPQTAGIPPVPRIPHRFLTLRPHPSPSPGPIIPNEDPFPFEADLRPPVEQPTRAAPPSHHVPTMGFGGALLAGVHHIIGPRNTSHRVERHNSWGVSGSFVLRWDSSGVQGEEENLLDEFGDMAFWGDDNNPFGARRSQLERAFKQRDRDNQAEPDYKPEYTHPDRPQPGFTHDFASSPSPLVAEDASSPSRRASGSGSRLCEATLVCASCRDPLVLGASDVGEDRAKRKLWSLRCGHLLDGKCIEKLMDPAPPTLDAAGASSTKTDMASANYPLLPSHDSITGDSMRTRLRPRHGMSGSSSSSSHPVPDIPSSGRRGVHARGQAIQRNNRKGKGKMKAPVVEAEHEWMCPVSGCSHVHLSLLMDGRWTMDEKRGAVAVFV